MNDDDDDDAFSQPCPRPSVHAFDSSVRWSAHTRHGSTRRVERFAPPPLGEPGGWRARSTLKSTSTPPTPTWTNIRPRLARNEKRLFTSFGSVPTWLTTRLAVRHSAP